MSSSKNFRESTNKKTTLGANATIKKGVSSSRSSRWDRKKNDGSRKAAEEVKRKAELAEEEVERQRIAAEEEAASQAALKAEEEQRLKNEGSIAWIKNEENRNDLIAWLRSVPLSNGCIERVDTAFSDGSLLAEVIHHFCPQMCNPRSYYKWNSRINKLSNWSALNSKVFPKLGFKLKQQQIDNLLNPFHCGKFEKDCVQGFFIYKLLFRIRRELASLNPKVNDYKKPNFEPPSCERKPARRELVNFLENPPFSKVEWLLEQGFYERDDAKPSVRKSACLPVIANLNTKKYTSSEEDTSNVRKYDRSAKTAAPNAQKWTCASKSEGCFEFDECNAYATIRPRPITENHCMCFAPSIMNYWNGFSVRPTLSYQWAPTPMTADCSYYSSLNSKPH